MASLGAAERRQVILHELAHVKRRDLPWGWPVEIARIVYFFHPLVYWVAHQLRLERELACDQLAMARSGHTAADYAQTLVQVVSHVSQPPAAGRRNLRRLERQPAGAKTTIATKRFLKGGASCEPYGPWATSIDAAEIRN